MKKNIYQYNLSIFLLLFILACKQSPPLDSDIIIKQDLSPYEIHLPAKWDALPVPANNPLTIAGVNLGRKLFYDPILSKDYTISCASCHKPERAFADETALSYGVQHLIGKRNAPPLFNLAWADNTPSIHKYFWDGGATSLERQVYGPITSSFEMAANLDTVTFRLNQNKTYKILFKKAFGIDSITDNYLSMALAQFERTLISSNAPFDLYLKGSRNLTQAELNGMNLFFTEGKGDCAHCHVNSVLFTDFSFQNNGLSEKPDSGLARITGKASDMGKFKVPSLRNLIFTAPYMHDGRFATLPEVIDFYNSSTKNSPTVSEFISKHFASGGLNLTPKDKADLIAFLLTLSDSSFIQTKAFLKP